LSQVRDGRWWGGPAGLGVREQLIDQLQAPRVDTSVAGVADTGPGRVVLLELAAYRVGLAQDRTRPSWRVLLWTDIPRATFERARASQPRDDGRDPLAAEREMLDWARQSGVLLISVDEVFHAGAPMPLAEFYGMERVKRVGLGFAAAGERSRRPTACIVLMTRRCHKSQLPAALYRPVQARRWHRSN